MEPGRDTAVIFAELHGAAEVYARAGDAAGHATVSSCIEKLEQTALSTEARVVKRIRERLMLLAESPDAAARTAVALQVAAREIRGGATGNLAITGNLGLGVAFHYGPVIQDNSDVFGDTVNTAARLVEQAAHGQILLAAETAEQVSALYRLSIRRLYAVQLKGLQEELALCELVWRADDPSTLYPFDAASGPSRAKLKLKYRGTKLVLRRASESLSIGRDPGCGLVIDDEHASRLHCTIERRRDHFVLADKSTNGTFIKVEGEEEILLKRDEYTLRKSGWISFGQSRSAGGEALEFSSD